MSKLTIATILIMLLIGVLGALASAQDAPAAQPSIIPLPVRTAEPVTIELAVNGDFQDGLTGWTLLNKSRDKVVCEMVAGDGGLVEVCRFQFRGSPTEAARLQQKILNLDTTLQAGDLLESSVCIETSSELTNIKASVKLFVDDGTIISSKVIFTPGLAACPLALLSHEVTQVIEKAKIVFANRSGGGRATMSDFTFIIKR